MSERESERERESEQEKDGDRESGIEGERLVGGCVFGGG